MRGEKKKLEQDGAVLGLGWSGDLIGKMRSEQRFEGTGAAQRLLEKCSDRPQSDLLESREASVREEDGVTMVSGSGHVKLHRPRGGLCLYSE